MAKKIIILERNEGSPPTFTVLFWLSVSPARQTYYAKVGKKSLWPGADQDTENVLIEGGMIFEERHEIPVDPNKSEAEIQAELLSRHAERQAEFTALKGPRRYGSYYDDVAGWTMTNLT